MPQGGLDRDPNVDTEPPHPDGAAIQSLLRLLVGPLLVVAPSGIKLRLEPASPALHDRPGTTGTAY